MTSRSPIGSSTSVPSAPVSRRQRGVFRTRITRHYHEHRRDLPWRVPETTPFGLLLAEMLLRQTRAEQVAPVWVALVRDYPAPADVRDAAPDALFTLLAPLGLGHQRVAALQAVASTLIERHGGQVPGSIPALLRLPHVGPYAAHAVACFGFGRRVPMVDANVLRVLSCVFGETYSPDNRRAPRAWAMAADLLPRRGPVTEYGYGLLDFSAAVCKPRRPDCHACALTSICAWNGQRPGQT